MNTPALTLASALASLAMIGCTSEIDTAITEFEEMNAELIEIAQTTDQQTARRSERFAALGERMIAMEAKLRQLEPELSDEQRERIRRAMLASKEAVDAAWQ